MAEVPQVAAQAQFSMSDPDKESLSDMKYDAYALFWYPLLRWTGKLQPDTIPMHVQLRL